MQSLGVPLSDDALTLMRLDVAMGAAKEKWELSTGCKPFLATEATLLLDPPGPETGPMGLYSGLANMGGSRKLFLPAGLWSLTDGAGNAAATITTGLTEDNDVGLALTVNKDFWLRPSNAAFQDKPFTYVEFRTTQYGQPQSISITGIWGRCLTVPSDVFYVLLQEVAVILAPNLALNISQGVYQWKTEDAQASFGGAGAPSPLSSEVAQWTGMIDKAAERYRRVGIS